jgi:hypothetical protein
VGSPNNEKEERTSRRLFLWLALATVMATAYASAVVAQETPGGNTPALPSAGASASSGSAAATVGPAASVGPSAGTGASATTKTNGLSLGAVAGLVLVGSGLVALRFIRGHGAS